MKEFERIERLLKTKSYDDLSKAEKDLIDQELSQQVYEELQMGINQVSGERIKVHRDIKRSLMSEFRKEDKVGFFSFAAKRLPAYVHVILIMIIGYLAFLLPPKERIITQDRMVEVMVLDTIEVTRVDTLFVEKFVKVPTPVYVAQDPNTSKSDEVKQVSNRSISEQKDVMDLVVRGLD